MAYGNRSSRDTLGNPLMIAQAAVGLAQNAGNIAHSITNIFDPGKSRDEQRLQRANFFRDSAVIGSVTAARYILGGLANTGSHEIPYYEAARSTVRSQAPDVMAAAEAQGAKWAAGIPDPGGTQSMIDDVKRDLATIAQQAPAAPQFTPATSTPSNYYPAAPTPTPRPQQLPAMQTTAPFNYTPWLIAGGGLLLASTLMRNH